MQRTLLAAATIAIAAVLGVAAPAAAAPVNAPPAGGATFLLDCGAGLRAAVAAPSTGYSFTPVFIVGTHLTLVPISYAFTDGTTLTQPGAAGTKTSGTVSCEGYIDGHDIGTIVALLEGQP